MTNEHTIFEQGKKFDPTKGNPIQKELSSAIRADTQKQPRESKHVEEENKKEEPLIKKVEEQEKKIFGEARDDETFAERIEKVYEDPRDILMDTSTVFPFDFFPDSLSIDPIKIRIKRSIFFSSGSIQSVLIRDVLDSYVEEAPIFATLKIITAKDKDHPLKIAPLKKKEAEKAMRIINGLVLGKREAPESNEVAVVR